MDIIWTTLWNFENNLEVIIMEKLDFETYDLKVMVLSYS